MRSGPPLLLCFLLLLGACTADPTESISYSNDKSDIAADNLISPKKAHALLKENPNKFIPIQVSKEKPFLVEHIPNAQNIWRPDYGATTKTPYGGLIPSREKLQGLLQNLGYENGRTLFLYDLKANVDALRFAWVLNLYGFDDFKIINGGLKFWKDSQLPVTKDLINQVAKSDFQLKEYFDDKIIANFEEVKNAIKDSNTILIDTREDYEFLGRPFIFKDSVLSYKIGAFDRGSIPSSIHLNWSTLADLKGDHRIKAERNLRFDLEEKGISPDKNIILYCQSGSRTSHTFYVLRDILGYENVKNYDGSWIEWSYMSSINKSVPVQQICSEEQFSNLLDSLTASLALE